MHAILDYMAQIHSGATGWVWLALGVVVVLSHVLPLTEKIPPNTPLGFFFWGLRQAYRGLYFVCAKSPVAVAVLTFLGVTKPVQPTVAQTLAGPGGAEGKPTISGGSAGGSPQ